MKEIDMSLVDALLANQAQKRLRRHQVETLEAKHRAEVARLLEDIEKMEKTAIDIEHELLRDSEENAAIIVNGYAVVLIRDPKRRQEVLVVPVSE